MYVVVQHRIKNPQAAFSRAENIVEDAPPGVRARQFFSSRDLSAATCLWEADSVEAVRNYIDSTLAESSENSYFEVATERAFGSRAGDDRRLRRAPTRDDDPEPGETTCTAACVNTAPGPTS